MSFPSDTKRLSASSIYSYNTMWSTGKVINGSGFITHSTLIGGIRNGVTIEIIYDNDSVVVAKISNYRDGRSFGPVYSYDNGDMNKRPSIVAYYYKGQSVDKEQYNKLISQ